jgi:hypothetical protein
VKSLRNMIELINEDGNLLVSKFNLQYLHELCYSAKRELELEEHYNEAVKQGLAVDGQVFVSTLNNLTKLIMWRSENIITYRIQRALGDGTFSDVHWGMKPYRST